MNTCFTGNVMSNDGLQYPQKILPQVQEKQPGLESLMDPRPIFDDEKYTASNKLLGKVAIITGGDSGIGRAVSIAYAKEGSDIVVVYLEEHPDAEETKKYVEKYGRKCLLFAGDVGNEEFCMEVVKKVISEFKRIDILVNNAAEQHPQNSIIDISKEQLQKTFTTNVFSCFYLTKACIPYLKKGASIINTSSITAYRGDEILLDYAATKGAITSFTRSLALNLCEMGIRVNSVAPGPIWTPLIPASFTKEKVGTFGAKTPMLRPGQPIELIGAYIFLASNEASFITGETIHVNGGEFVCG